MATLELRNTSSVTPPVQLRNVVRQFGPQRVIDGLDLDIAAGEFVALLGASGSGKTTLLRTLAGLDDIDSGELRVPVARAAVFQEPRLMPWKSAWKNVVLGLRINDAKARAEAALTEVGLAHRLNAFPATLSGGEAQRVALARGLVREPKLLARRAFRRPRCFDPHSHAPVDHRPVAQAHPGGAAGNARCR
ncbi:Aliphatic sulfonates import ATP-binding protein SsuB [Pseudomonas meliae]|uniref:Aliphatic sulfonates import ATP-binding protein SsuB n=1 Tax=Pseudomonas meliae TaxID=86176 RepID=A0A0P9WGA2_9PSED|nr:Aliphatic sulfonates import ATP-binding protein SsuB [Pseudomonas meliae]